jgi:hypothetical protein
MKAFDKLGEVKGILEIFEKISDIQCRNICFRLPSTPANGQGTALQI